ncbi:MAG: membrane protein insertase YidC [Bacteroidota bacterium]
MDRNSIIGLVIIGLILSVFTIYNQPSAEDIAKQKKEITKQKELKKEAVANAAISKAKKEVSIKADSTTVIAGDTVAKVVVAQVEKTVTLENSKLKAVFTTKGGQVASVALKNYQSYTDFAKSGYDKADGKLLTLFKKGDAVNQLVIPVDGKTIRTAFEDFQLVEQSADKVIFELKLNNEQSIKQIYTLNKDAYDLDYQIQLKGFNGKVNAKNVLFNWDLAYRKSERLFSEQRKVSTVCFNYKESGLDYLSEITDDYQDAEESVEWVAYKQSYFSSILKPTSPIAKEGTKFKVTNYKEGHSKNWSHLKDYSSYMNLDLKDLEFATVNFSWYFGPNDYETLRTYESGYDNILNFGWGLFRWINIYAVQPLFNFIVTKGVAVGWAILLLTLLLKLVLMPIQWKMYVSSAKMRILKPEVEALGVKYPKKDDAMKKQMEMMALYRESGASPFAGCLPMLLQMPILLAVFRFFPASFELRQQSFLWAEDLSSYDSIANFGFNLWPYGDHVSLFTLLMAGTTMIYTIMNSGQMQQPTQPGMPNMKVIMYIFPVLMIFFFNNFASGLSYYYFISTLITILLMFLIKQFFVDEQKLKMKMADKKANSAGKEKKKSKFQERIEQMQKAQQEQMKNRKK